MLNVASSSITYLLLPAEKTTLRDLMRAKSEENSHKPFGGKVIVLEGDFR